jgi:hypothetical protein
MVRMAMHLDGVKRMVNIRGGLRKIKESSPITANLVYWYIRASFQTSILGAKFPCLGSLWSSPKSANSLLSLKTNT